jgi:hypothetical protein
MQLSRITLPCSSLRMGPPNGDEEPFIPSSFLLTGSLARFEVFVKQLLLRTDRDLAATNAPPAR